jgi:hypothetical protein
MEPHKRVTEEDLLITEALIGKSYYQLKQSVIEAPSRACRSAGQMVRQHPYATAGAAIVAGVAVYGIFKMINSGTSARGGPGSTRKKDSGGLCLMQQMLPMLMPLVVPSIGGYIQRYLGKMSSGERD